MPLIDLLTATDEQDAVLRVCRCETDLQTSEFLETAFYDRKKFDLPNLHGCLVKEINPTHFVLCFDHASSQEFPNFEIKILMQTLEGFPGRSEAITKPRYTL